MFRTLALIMLFLPLAVGAENAPQSQVMNTSAVTKKLQANVVLHSLDELKQLLVQAEKISNGESDVEYSRGNPIAVVLYGEEIQAFVRSNYRTHKELVDLAARLDAFNVIEVKVCQQWMGANGIKANELPPFVESVPIGAGERVRLEKSGYAYF